MISTTELEPRGLRVLVAGPSPLMTSVWSTAIASSTRFSLVGNATSVEETLALAPESDVVLLSALTQVEAGVEWVRLVTRVHPESRILVVGIPHEEHVILAYVEAGASAYIPQQETVERVLEWLPRVARGEAHISPEVAPALVARLARLRQAYVEPESLGTRLEALTPREREILDLVARNLSNRQIAERVLIEVGTVKNHVHNILDKLSLESRHQVASQLHGWRVATVELVPSRLQRGGSTDSEDRDPAAAGRPPDCAAHSRARDAGTSTHAR